MPLLPDIKERNKGKIVILTTIEVWLYSFEVATSQTGRKVYIPVSEVASFSTQQLKYYNRQDNITHIAFFEATRHQGHPFYEVPCSKIF